MKKHFIGATYELTAENMNNLIQQLETLKDELDEAYKNQYELLSIIEGLHCEKMTLLKANAALSVQLEHYEILKRISLK